MFYKRFAKNWQSSLYKGFPADKTEEFPVCRQPWPELDLVRYRNDSSTLY